MVAHFISNSAYSRSVGIRKDFTFLNKMEDNYYPTDVQRMGAS